MELRHRKKQKDTDITEEIDCSDNKYLDKSEEFNERVQRYFDSLGFKDKCWFFLFQVTTGIKQGIQKARSEEHSKLRRQYGDNCR
jgi:hypothetical protein